MKAAAEARRLERRRAVVEDDMEHSPAMAKVVMEARRQA
jgi:hypothetical protein